MRADTVRFQEVSLIHSWNMWHMLGLSGRSIWIYVTVKVLLYYFDFLDVLILFLSRFKSPVFKNVSSLHLLSLITTLCDPLSVKMAKKVCRAWAKAFLAKKSTKCRKSKLCFFLERHPKFTKYYHRNEKGQPRLLYSYQTEKKWIFEVIKDSNKISPIFAILHFDFYLFSISYIPVKKDKTIKPKTKNGNTTTTNRRSNYKETWRN